MFNQYSINKEIEVALSETTQQTKSDSGSKVALPFLLVLNNKKTTNFMQAVDIFSKSKCLAEIVIYKTPLFEQENFKQVFQMLIDTTFNNDIYELVAAIPINLEKYSYINKKYRELSDGKKSLTLHNFLECYGVPHEIDSNMFII